MSNSSAIYAVLQAIPPGRVATYGQVAALAGLPRAARLVGHTLRGLPEHSTLPWHRVINAQGRIALPAGSPGYLEQVARLAAEGVTLQSGRVRLSRYQWLPTAANPKHHSL